MYSVLLDQWLAEYTANKFGAKTVPVVEPGVVDSGLWRSVEMFMIAVGVGFIAKLCAEFGYHENIFALLLGMAWIDCESEGEFFHSLQHRFSSVGENRRQLSIIATGVVLGELSYVCCSDSNYCAGG